MMHTKIFSRRVLLLLLLCLILSTSTISAQILSDTHFVPFASSVTERSETADLNSDGWPDVIVFGQSRMSWLPNDGTGDFFKALPILDLPDIIRDTRFADLDGNGHQDVIWVDDENTVVWWMENDGLGNFGTVHSIEMGSGYLFRLLVSDFNMDGHSDILVDMGPVGFALILNQGNGMFAPPSLFGTDVQPSSAILNDLDMDGDIDIVYHQDSDQEIMWLENDIDMFTSTAAQSLGVQSYWFYLADVDGDGDQDIRTVVTGPNAGFLDYHNDGALNFDEVVSTPFEWEWPLDEFEDVIDGDFDQDGDLDAILAFSTNLPGDEELYFLENLGNGSYAEMVEVASVGNIREMKSADLDLDGDLDIQLTYYTTSSLGSSAVGLENQGGGSFGLPYSLEKKLGSSSWIVPIDVDFDGREELLAGGSGEDGFIYNTDEDLAIFSDYLFEIGADSEMARGYDWDEDGNQDLVIARGSEVILLLNLGGGQFAPPTVILDLEVVDFLFGDVDNDGIADWLYAYEWQDPVDGEEYYRVAMRKGLGSGQWSDEEFVSPRLSSIYMIDLEDLNVNGSVDLIVLAHRALWYPNEGDGSFCNANSFGGPNAIMKLISLADFDGDGDKDAVTTTRSETWIGNQQGRFAVYHENVGNGQFADVRIIFEGEEFESIDALMSVDVDYDGDMDFLVSEFHTHLALNNGDGTFLTTELPAFVDASQLLFVDADGDSDGDIIQGLGTYGPNDIAWNENFSLRGCVDPTACNYNPQANEDDGSCCYTNCGCGDPQAENYNGSGTCHIPGSCTYIPGCMDEEADNFDPNATQDDGSCQYPSGCIDDDAINYDENALVDDGSCVFVTGCKHAHAVNFNPDAIVEDCSCVYAPTGLVWHDTNGNGSLSTNEERIPGAIVLMQSSGSMAITDDEGEFLLPFVEEGTYTIMTEPSQSLPFFTTTNPVDVEYGGLSNSPIRFGLNHDSVLFNISSNIYPHSNPYVCSQTSTHDIVIKNLGNTTTDVVMAIEYDEDFTSYSESIGYPIDSVSDGVIYMSHQGLEPGQTRTKKVKLTAPQNISDGELFTAVRAYGYHSGAIVAQGYKERELGLGCSFDPNDKQVFPIGYTDEHFISADTILDYLVRFQNVGTAPAFDVLIRDTLDSSLDLSTFQLDGHSHSVMVALDMDSRELQFIFEDIQLPDSASNEPESHGFVAYSIRPYEDIELSERIENTAHIYFDFNDAIVTNTTYNTIIDCDSMIVEPVMDTLWTCIGQAEELELTSQLVEQWNWQYGNEIFEDTTSISIVAMDQTIDHISIRYSNPLCPTDSVEIPIVYGPAPEISLPFEIALCPGDSVTLDASAQDWTWSWTINGQLVSTTNQYVVLTDDDVTLTVQNQFCEASHEVSVSHWPIPPIPEIDFDGQHLVTTEQVGVQYQWYLNGEAIDGADSWQFTPEQGGEYSLEVTNENGCSSASAIEIVPVSLVELNSVIVSISPNPADDVLNINLEDNSQETQIVLFSSSGAEVSRKRVSIGGGHVQLPLSKFESGAYTVRIISGGAIKEFPLLIQH